MFVSGDETAPAETGVSGREGGKMPEFLGVDGREEDSAGSSVANWGSG